MKKKHLFLSFALLLMAVPAWSDKPVPWQMYFQESVTPVMDQIIHLHNVVMVIIVLIGILVLGLLGYVTYRFRASRNPTPSKTSHHTVLEIVWTAIPVLILLAISFPSLRLIYFMDKAEHADMTLKITGRQWYWHYEYPEQKISFDSVMVPEKELKPGQTRLLEVDHQVVLPVDTTVRLLFTADDVLHSWAVPAFGVKQDTVPGRVAEAWIRVRKEGTYYGQCSELCGTGHSFMPIAVRVVSKEEYKKWLEEAQKEFAQVSQENQAIMLALR